MAKKKPEGEYTNAYIDGCDEDGYSVFYTDLKGGLKSQNLDADDYASAKFEAANLLGIPESEVGDG